MLLDIKTTKIEILYAIGYRNIILPFAKLNPIAYLGYLLGLNFLLNFSSYQPLTINQIVENLLYQQELRLKEAVNKYILPDNLSKA